VSNLWQSGFSEHGKNVPAKPLSVMAETVPMMSL